MFEILIHFLGIVGFACLIILRGSPGSHGWLFTLFIFAVPASKMLSLSRSHSGPPLWMVKSEEGGDVNRSGMPG